MRSGWLRGCVEGETRMKYEKIPKQFKLTAAEKHDILKKWGHREVGVGEIQYVEDLVLQKVMPHVLSEKEV